VSEMKKNIEFNSEINNFLLDLNRKELGIFFTPKWMVKFMVNLINLDVIRKSGKVKIMEPACGFCQFLMEVRDSFKKSRINNLSMVGVEINDQIIQILKEKA